MNGSRLNVQSLRNKTTAIHEIIEERDLDAAILPETWHGSSLRLAVPTGFSAVDAVRKSDPNHAGLSFSIAAATEVSRYPFRSSRRSRVCIKTATGCESNRQLQLLTVFAGTVVNNYQFNSIQGWAGQLCQIRYRAVI